ncbi:MAG: HAMP domain-containing histidine kinase [Bacteroidaceae bacterium]|nr:HAMP domain-containing histidine kinase [Bacteroidaceae bacterium]
MTDPHILILVLAGILIVAAAVRFYRHQCLLRDRAYLMREAVRNRDFSFRLPVKGLFFGERAMQQALNDMSLDIKALEARKEVESWQRLTRVLTHEIMNAATPICSISQAYLADPSIKGTPYEEGIIAIHQTGMGMTAFVENYRKLTDLQEAELEEVDLQQTLETLGTLYPDVAWHIRTDGQLRFKADRGMMLQVLSNLAKNACEAGAKDIDIRWDNTLLISNNGAPIPPDVAREIFVPFFTTKQTGSGIGLALARLMMHKQGMNLSLAEQPVPGFRTTFVISKLP